MQIFKRKILVSTMLFLSIVVSACSTTASVPDDVDEELWEDSLEMIELIDDYYENQSIEWEYLDDIFYEFMSVGLEGTIDDGEVSIEDRELFFDINNLYKTIDPYTGEIYQTEIEYHIAYREKFNELSEKYNLDKEYEIE